jgi:dipeptidyl aminopeptidase/acylaminoacyl peptidase
MGAALVLQAAHAENDFCAVVAESPFSTFRQVAFDRVGYYIGLGPWFGRTVARPLVEIAFIYARARYHVNLQDANPENSLRNSNTPVLLIHGQADKNILPWHSEELASHDLMQRSGSFLTPGTRERGKQNPLSLSGEYSHFWPPIRAC